MAIAYRMLKKSASIISGGGGDFRNQECIDLLKQSDIIVTNPPFSLFREYVAQLIQYKKKFLIIGNINAIAYKEIFPLIKDNKIWLGHNNAGMEFGVLNQEKLQSVRAIWYTNLDYATRREDIILYKKYTPEEYPKYDNYNVINVDKTKEIPMDYDGIMGVPISFMTKYNPDQFEILGNDYNIGQGLMPELIKTSWNGKTDRGYINGNRLYTRILIKHKKTKK